MKYPFLFRLQAELEEARIKAQEEIMVEIQVAKVTCHVNLFDLILHIQEKTNSDFV